MESFKTRQGMTVKDAATEGIYRWFQREDSQTASERLLQEQRPLVRILKGKVSEILCTVYHDEDLNQKAREWVQEHDFKKGEPTMTAGAFCEYANNHLLPSSHLPPFFPRSISMRTAVRWLHHLGFKPRDHKKGVYIDGHEREDVIKHRQRYLKQMEDLRKAHQPLSQWGEE